MLYIILRLTALLSDGEEQIEAHFRYEENYQSKASDHFEKWQA